MHSKNARVALWVCEQVPVSAFFIIYFLTLTTKAVGGALQTDEIVKTCSAAY